MLRLPGSGGQPVYSAIAIETGLALRLVFHQPLRQTEGMLRSIADVLGVDCHPGSHDAQPSRRRPDDIAEPDQPRRAAASPCRQHWP
jgi:Transposase DDE domain